MTPFLRLWPFVENRLSLFAALGLVPVVALLQTANPLLIRAIIDGGIVPKNSQALYQLSLVWLVVVLSDYLARALFGSYSVNVVQGTLKSLRNRLIGHTLSLPVSFHDLQSSGALASKITSDVDLLGESLDHGFLSTAVDVGILAGGILGLYFLSGALGLTVSFLFLILYFAVRYLLGLFRRTVGASRVCFARLSGYAQESLSGLKTIQLLKAQPGVEKNFDGLNKALCKTQERGVVIDATVFAFIDGFSTMTLSVVFYFAAVRLWGFGALDAGTLVAFVKCLDQVYDPLKQVGNRAVSIQGAYAALERIFQLLDHQETVEGEGVNFPSGTELAFESVRFHYQNQKQALEGISFSVPQGTSLALVGVTGAGKTTVLKLLAKVYGGYEGSIRVGGREISQVSPLAWAERISYVPQEPALFNDSIEFNISLGRPEITSAAVERAAQAVGLGDFIQSLPLGYRSKIKEGGSGLSRGQRQLVAFARALVSDPSLLLLDEVTASLDPASEELVSHAIEKLFAGRTVVVVAHRLSTIKRCDQILVMEEGKVKEVGDHEALVAAGGRYAEMFRLSRKARKSGLPRCTDQSLIESTP